MAQVSRRGLLQSLLLAPFSALVGKMFGREPERIPITAERVAAEDISATEDVVRRIFYTELQQARVGRPPRYYLDTYGRYVPVDEVRLFLDWTPLHPEQPKYARFKEITSGGGNRTELVTISGQ